MKKLVVLGGGISGYGSAILARRKGFDVFLSDSGRIADRYRMKLEAWGVPYEEGGHREGRILAASECVKSPGIPDSAPIVRKLRERGVPVISEIEFAGRYLDGARTICITGSNGKTTTTSLVYRILRDAGCNVALGGNIGESFAYSVATGDYDWYVLELSSFQLMSMERSADIAVVTNVAPNHLDVHKDMAEYVQAKKNVFAHQSEAGKVILNYDNAITRGFAADANGTVEYFSRQTKPENGVYLEDGVIYRNGKRIMAAADIRIPGVHNIENYMAAACAVEGLATEEDIDEIARTFAGVEHRIEFVRELDGVKYYNDSIASSPSRTIAGLHSFHQKLVLIAGGYDKKIPFDVLGPEICAHVRLLILCGATAEKIEAAVKSAPNYLNGQPEILHAQTLEEAVRLAKQYTVPGDIVTLSPACAAFDQFKNFMVRGETYKTLVQGL